MRPDTTTTSSTTTMRPDTTTTSSTTTMRPDTTTATTVTTEVTTVYTSSTPRSSTTTEPQTTTVSSAPPNETTTTKCTPADADAYCDSIFPGSFCVTYKLPNVCHGTDKPCGCPTRPTTSATTTKIPVTTGSTPKTTTTTRIPETTVTEPKTTPGDIDCKDADDYCSSILPGSRCQFWLSPSVCSGTEDWTHDHEWRRLTYGPVKCHCGHRDTTSTTISSTMTSSPVTTSTTMTTVGRTSTIASTTESPNIPNSPDCADADAYCSSFIPGSYCMYWKTPSTCHSDRRRLDDDTSRNRELTDNIRCVCGESKTSTVYATDSTRKETSTAHEKTSTAITTTRPPKSPSGGGSYSKPDCREADAQCEALKPGSYCMYFKLPSTCHGLDVPCKCQ
ncbi:hypothetical protein FOL47_000324 [Perkinsus chesapeaki]|uniref:Uncharacterized protein n=1 Tax=Perkinsus chesapeaki TaxID=330153 RepID=A0A7J6KX85_PERCH|nr:hypothetical protein FOL47_000324 [Perkinsus chesapeaki]